MSEAATISEKLISVERQSRDVRKAAETLDRAQARYYVDEYYQMQENRIRAEGRIRAMTSSGEPHLLVDWLETQFDLLEQQISGALGRYSNSHPLGQWMRSNRGIGPVIAAGFLANWDITRRNEQGDIICETAGHLWSMCGLDPSLNAEGHRKDRRTRGVKMRYNPALKRLCWILGESFKRAGDGLDENGNAQAGKKEGYYRIKYDERKAIENTNNAAGVYAEQAALSLTEKKFGEATDAIKWYTGDWTRDPDMNPAYGEALNALPRIKPKGKAKAASANVPDPAALAQLNARFPNRPMLPPARIDRRAARWATKLFLSNLHQVSWAIEFGHDVPYPFPYAIAQLGHTAYMAPPNLDVVGLKAVNGAVVPI